MPDPDDVATAAERSAYATADPGEEPRAAEEPAASPGQAAPSSPGLLERLPWWTVPAILLGVPLLVAAAVQVQPSLYDNVVWKDYWGPIKADALNCAYLSNLAPNTCTSSSSAGVLAHSGYNPVNTLTWAVLLGVCILGLAQMLAAFRTPMDDKLILAATAWVVVGSVTHVLEDTGLLAPPLQYFFITPPIYLVFGAFGVLSFLLGQWMVRIAQRGGLHAALRVLWLVHIVVVLVWLGLWWKGWPQITHYVNPLWVAAFAAINFLVARWVTLRAGRVDPSLLTMLLSLGTYLLVGAYVLTYIRDPWPPGPPGDGLWFAFLLAPVLALAVAALVYALGRGAPKVLLAILIPGGSLLGGALAAYLVQRIGSRLGIAALAGLSTTAQVALAVVFALAIAVRAWSKLRPHLAVTLPDMAIAYTLAINVFLVFSQMLDGFATALGIDLAGYQEKHVLSAGVIDGTRDLGTRLGLAFVAHYPTFVGFATVKLVVSLLVIYAIDVSSKADTRRHPTLIGLVKFAIIMVGIGPGVRDFTRLSLGV